MNNAELEKLLKRARVPESTESYWNELPLRVRNQLGRASKAGAHRRRLIPRLAWGLVTASICCLMIAFAFGRWSGRTGSSSPHTLLANAKVIHEMMALFPNRIRAIEWDERGLHLSLSEEANVPDSPPIFVQVCDGKNCSAWVTFSGQELQIARDKVEVLVDAQGHVILVGDRLFWSKGEMKLAQDHLRIQARLLASNGKEARG